MIKVAPGVQLFGSKLENFELNRMYPPGHRKESPMLDITTRDRMFELHTENHKLNQIHLSMCRKESPMVKLSQKHVDAICHCELFIDPIFVKIDSARLRKHLEDDLLSLAELKLYIFTVLAKGPKFPEIEADEPDDPGNSKSRV